MICSQTTAGACVQVHPVSECDADEVKPPLANNCVRPEGGDMTIQAPEPYVLVVKNVPDENA